MPQEFQNSLAQIKNRLADLESETDDVIARLLKRRSQIEASDKRLASLHSQCSILCSSLALLEEVLLNRLRAARTSEPFPEVPQR